MSTLMRAAAIAVLTAACDVTIMSVGQNLIFGP